MAAYSKEFLSGSVNGRPIKVALAASPGTLIHTAHATAKDEVWLWASNTDSFDRSLTIEFGGTTNPDDRMVMGIPAGEKVLICEGLPLSGGLLARAFASTANVITVAGYVNRIT